MDRITPPACAGFQTSWVTKMKHSGRDQEIHMEVWRTDKQYGGAKELKVRMEIS